MTLKALIILNWPPFFCEHDLSVTWNFLGGKISGHRLGTWSMPPVIVDEELYRSNFQNSKWTEVCGLKSLGFYNPIDATCYFRLNYKLYPLSLVKVQFSPLILVSFQLTTSVKIPLKFAVSAHKNDIVSNFNEIFVFWLDPYGFNMGLMGCWLCVDLVWSELC